MEVDIILNDLKKEISNLREAIIGKVNDEYLGLKDAAGFLKISVSTMQKISASRLIPVYKPSGGKVFFLKSDLLDYLNSGRLRTRSQVESDAIKRMEVQHG